MILNLDTIEEKSIPAFKGGEKSTELRMFNDGLNKIMKGHLQPGASIGLHTHESGSEVIFLTKGDAHVLYDGQLLEFHEGECHYCAKGHSHSLINDSDDDVWFTAVVPEQ